VYTRQRIVHPFFNECINQAYLSPEKQIYIMDGCVATGKSNNFTFAAPYALSQEVEPILRNGRMMRESMWAAIRESENSSVATIMEILYDSVFPPDVIDSIHSPVKKRGAHPTHIIIEHELKDGTWVHMDIECHGFNNKEAEVRLRSRSFVGCIIPEMQGVPWEIIEVARQRSGRWRPSQVRMRRMIDGKLYTLSGVKQLKLVFADANIPKRPHAMYDVLYDAPLTGKDCPYLVMTVPSPIKPVPVVEIKDSTILEKYPQTTYKREKVVWLPRPNYYYLTKHFEQDVLDEEGEPVIVDGIRQTVPWSGYEYWFSEIQQNDSIVGRHIIGVPDQIGGDSAIYQTFDKETHVAEREFDKRLPVWVGVDLGLFAGWIFIQEYPDDTLHVFHEIVINHSDGLITEAQITDFVVPYKERMLKFNPSKFVPDPAGRFGNASGVSAVALMRKAGLIVENCKAMNQDTDTRRDSLGFYLKHDMITVSESCPHVIKGLLGGYRYKTTRSGVVSGMVDKNEYSHTIEALQYPCINLHRKLTKKLKSKAQGGSYAKQSMLKITKARR